MLTILYNTIYWQGQTTKFENVGSLPGLTVTLRLLEAGVCIGIAKITVCYWFCRDWHIISRF